MAAKRVAVVAASPGGLESGGGDREKRKERNEKENKKWWVPRLEGERRVSKNGGWEREFEEVCKTKVCLEALL
jgi:hypothetical protein